MKLNLKDLDEAGHARGLIYLFIIYNECMDFWFAKNNNDDAIKCFI